MYRVLDYPPFFFESNNIIFILYLIRMIIILILFLHHYRYSAVHDISYSYQPWFMCVYILWFIIYIYLFDNVSYVRLESPCKQTDVCIHKRLQHYMHQHRMCGLPTLDREHILTKWWLMVVFMVAAMHDRQIMNQICCFNYTNNMLIVSWSSRMLENKTFRLGGNAK